MPLTHPAPLPRVGQSWPVVPDHLRSHAAGLPRVVLVELGETPPQPQEIVVVVGQSVGKTEAALLANPLYPETMRGLVKVVDPPAAPPAPASLAARALRMLGRLVASAALFLICGFAGLA